MTTTPHQIAEFLTPWMLGSLAYALLFLTLRSLGITGVRVGTTMLFGERRFTGKDIGNAGLLVMVSLFLTSEIESFQPGPQWWSQPLASVWEISFGVMTVLLSAAERLLQVTTLLLAVVCVLAGAVWLYEPVDDSDPTSLTRKDWLWRSVVSSWNAYRHRRTHAGDGERA